MEYWNIFLFGEVVYSKEMLANVRGHKVDWSPLFFVVEGYDYHDEMWREEVLRVRKLYQKLERVTTGSVSWTYMTYVRSGTNYNLSITMLPSAFEKTPPDRIKVLLK